MIDCTIYSAALIALTFCAPLIRDRAVVLLDEWKLEALGGPAIVSGEGRAFEEFLAGNPDLRAEELPPYQPASKVFLVTREEAVTSHELATRATQHTPAPT